MKLKSLVLTATQLSSTPPARVGSGPSGAGLGNNDFARGKTDPQGRFRLKLAAETRQRLHSLTLLTRVKGHGLCTVCWCRALDTV